MVVKIAVIIVIDIVAVTPVVIIIVWKFYHTYSIMQILLYADFLIQILLYSRLYYVNLSNKIYCDDFIIKIWHYEFNYIDFIVQVFLCLLDYF